MLKIKRGFLLRKLGTENIAVAIGEASKNFNGMIRLNNTGTFYWEKLEKGTTEEQLITETLKRYKNPDADAVRQDIKEFINTISFALDYDAPDN